MTRILNDMPLHIETYFHRGTRYTTTWRVASDGSQTLVAPQAVDEENLEFSLFDRAGALYHSCASDGYQLMRFGRILGNEASSTTNTATQSGAQTSWLRAAFAQGQEGYIDICASKIVKLSDADFRRLSDGKRSAKVSKTDSGAATRRTEFNKAMRKYGITSPSRMACFFGNVLPATQWFQKFYEHSPFWYRPWDGRGYLQLTNCDNYATHWKFHGISISDQLSESMAAAHKRADDHITSSYSSIWGVQGRFLSFSNAQVVFMDALTYSREDGSTASVPQDFTRREIE
ncbi:hypothetical protein [Paraburkholderia bannensis]|uniref:hypothetical protein n=1 Tax=Paraburkholderia bannensis TaxID=765414 RepID=UPI002AB6AEC4|nr:hypothetical protein [Paraburkholderia bannensis]